MHLEDRPDLIEKSIPDYPAMGKRILQDNGSWLRTPEEAERRARPHADRADRPRRRRDRRRHRSTRPTSSVTRPASGTTTSSRSMEVRGRGGVSIRDQWGDEPTAYLGITVPNFPNLFCMYGPGTNLAHGASLFFHSECQIHYAMDCIHRVLASGARTHRGPQGRPRRVRRAPPARDRPARLGAPVDRAQPLQEPATARSSRCRRGASSSTGNGPAPRIPKPSSSAEKSRRPVGSRRDERPGSDLRRAVRVRRSGVVARDGGAAAS